MRIISVRLRNLNSLAGEWEIDFTAPEYVSDGIFAITGPTGSGKTTILDAVCLSLYGRTPRLKSLNQSSNEIMSRMKADCSAETVFETSAGRFRCIWRQHRARNKLDGRLAAADHEISEADTGKPLETKKTEVLKKVESLTGMDFDQFTRAVMLAQGEFAAFLASSPDQRAPILEQITGTEIYGRLSVYTHQRLREEKAEVDKIRTRKELVRVMDEDEEKALKRAISIKKKEEGLTEKNLSELNRKAALVLESEEIESIKAALTLKKSSFEQEESNFISHRRRLEKYRIAEKHLGLFRTMASVRKKIGFEKETAEKLEIELKELEKNFEEKRKSSDGLASGLLELRERKDQVFRKTARVRMLDRSAGEKRNRLKISEERNKKIAGQIAEDARVLDTLQEEMKAGKKKLESLAQDLPDSDTGDILQSEISGLVEKLKNIKTIRHRLDTALLSIAESERYLEKKSAEVKSKAAEAEDFRIRADNKILKLKRMESDIEKLSDGISVLELRKEHTRILSELRDYSEVKNFSTERERLEDGQPCPLCGALHHPYIGKLPDMATRENREKELENILASIEQLSESKNILQEELQGLKDSFSDTDRETRVGEVEKNETVKQISRLKSETEADAVAAAELEESIRGILEKLGMDRYEDPDVLIPRLTLLAEDWKKRRKDMSEFESIIKDNEARTRELESKRDRDEALLKEIIEEEVKLEKELSDEETERKELLGEDDPDDTEKNWEIKIKKGEEALSRARVLMEKAGSSRIMKKAELEGILKNVSRLEEEYTEDEKLFLDGIKKDGFESVADYEKNILTGDEAERIEALSEKLSEKKAELEREWKSVCERESRILGELERVEGEKNPVKLEENRKKTEALLRELSREIGALTHQLESNEQGKADKKQLSEFLRSAEKDLAVWMNLHDLIGSADGKKFRNFAQGLTFDWLLASSNRALVKMTDRYILVRGEDNPLELKIVDTWQAGDIRSTENLSGGESFMVSLALALGLSGMASSRIRVDSLFLDEGFGTLDSEALETALSTLAGLHHENKLIGIISHVPEIKERISAKISIKPLSGGVSVVEGPGCRRIG